MSGIGKIFGYKKNILTILIHVITKEVISDQSHATPKISYHTEGNICKIYIVTVNSYDI